MIPCNFKLSRFHVFRARASTTGSIVVKKLSTDGEEISFNLLRRGMTRATLDDLHDDDHVLNIERLEGVVSKQHATRCNYLKVDVLERYYANNEEVKGLFFFWTEVELTPEHRKKVI